MGTTTFSMRIDADIKKALEEEARRQDRSAAWIAKEAISDFLDRQAYKRECIEEAVREADKGVFISGDAVMAWMQRWAEGYNDPPPEPDIFPEGYKR